MTKATEPSYHLPLAAAALCASCEAIYRLEEERCPACTDSQRLILARIIPATVSYVVRDANAAAAAWARRGHGRLEASGVAS